jgi:prolyl-tRNA synthetase
MRLSNYFLPVQKENPTEASITSHRLMLRAGMIKQLTSGVYNWLPLGLKVLSNIKQIVRKEMNKAGCIELLMPCIQPAELWMESGRYEDYGKEMLRIKDRHDRDNLFGPTNEEVITDLFRNTIRTYKELPKNFYQIQWKFRDEIRPRFGVMRGREFLMKDAYSFDLDFAGAKKSYDNMFESYFRTFKALGLNAIAVKADSGAIGGNLSHEFHVLADTGESEVFYDAEYENLAAMPELDIEKIKSLYAASDEKHDPNTCPVPEERLTRRRGIEVGHVFYFGTKYSKAMNAYVTNQHGEQVLVEMGSYGIGVSRLVGAIIEASHDEKGIIWPNQVAPFDLAIINLKASDSTCRELADELYQHFMMQNYEVLYDDNNESVRSKFATNDLIGTPWQIVIGPKLAKDNLYEVKNRATGEQVTLSREALYNKFPGKK